MDCWCLVHPELADEDGSKIHLVDYASAGRDWETDIAAWIKTNMD